MDSMLDQFDDMYKYNVVVDDGGIIDMSDPFVSSSTSLEDFIETIDKTLDRKQSSFLLQAEATTTRKGKKNNEIKNSMNNSYNYYGSTRSLFQNMDYSITYDDEENNNNNDNDFILQSFKLRNDNNYESSPLFSIKVEEENNNNNNNDELEGDECWNDKNDTTMATMSSTKSNRWYKFITTKLYEKVCIPNNNYHEYLV